MPIILVLRRLQQQDHWVGGQPGLHSELQPSLSCIMRSSFVKSKMIAMPEVSFFDWEGIRNDHPERSWYELVKLTAPEVVPCAAGVDESAFIILGFYCSEIYSLLLWKHCGSCVTQGALLLTQRVHFTSMVMHGVHQEVSQCPSPLCSFLAPPHPPCHTTDPLRKEHLVVELTMKADSLQQFLLRDPLKLMILWLCPALG